MKKIYAFVLALAVLLTAVPLSVAAIAADDYSYDFIGDTVIIEGYYGDDTDLVIPATIEGCPVTAIGEYAFSYCDMETVVIPDTVTAIEAFAFDSCKLLESVTLPKELQVLGEGAFASCKKLTAIVIPDGVTEIGEMCFDYCLSLETVVLPDSLTTIGEWAFCSCESLTSLTIPASVTAIGAWAFDECTALESVYFQGDAAQIEIGEDNPCFTEAAWYCANPVLSGGMTSVSPEVSGLGFLFDVAATGGDAAEKLAYVNGSAQVTPYTDGAAYTLVRMGAVVTNREDALLTLSALDGVHIVDIPATYLWELGEDALSYAVRVIDIPDSGKDTPITARPYYVYEKDGVETVVYGTPVTQTYNAVQNG